MTDVASRIASSAGDPAALLALAIELAQENARLNGQVAALEQHEADRKAAQAERQRRHRHVVSRDVTLPSVTERDVTSEPPSPPAPFPSFPEPHITLSPSPLSPEGSLSARAKGESDYPPDFLACWAAYPRRGGGNSKRGAFRAWSARIRAGATPALLLAGVERYAAHVRATGREGSSFVMQAATFFGPDEHWLETWALPVAVTRGEVAPSRPRVPFVSVTEEADRRHHADVALANRYEGEKREAAQDWAEANPEHDDPIRAAVEATFRGQSGAFAQQAKDMALLHERAKAAGFPSFDEWQRTHQHAGAA